MIKVISLVKPKLLDLLNLLRLSCLSEETNRPSTKFMSPETDPGMHQGLNALTWDGWC